MPKLCMFCGRDDRKITKEHLFPNWLKPLFDPSIKGIHESVTLDGKIVFRFEAKLFEQTVNDVCNVCNNGWMSDLESDVQPILTKMLLSRNIVLDKVKQKRLAIWAYKTMLVMNYKNPAPPQAQIIPKAAYRNFYETKELSAGHIMTLGYKSWKSFSPGSMLGTNRIAQVSSLTVPKDLGPRMRAEIDKGAKVYGVTLQLATVVFQLMTSDVNLGDKSITITLPPEPLRVLNPYQNKIRWTLKHTVNEVGGIEAIHEAITGMQYNG